MGDYVFKQLKIKDEEGKVWNCCPTQLSVESNIRAVKSIAAGLGDCTVNKHF